MDTGRRILRFGMVMILCAALLRLGVDRQVFNRENFLSAMVLLQTGRLVTWQEVPEQTLPAETVPPEVPTEPQPSPLALTQEDLDSLRMKNLSGYGVDARALLQEPLRWDLQKGGTVLILHTHGTESYTNTEGYEEDSAYRTTDERYNMISIGKELARLLEEAGLRVIQDTTPYDLPSYSGSYNQARQALRQHLEENPDICLVLDLHRDAMTDENGEQIGTTAQTDRGTAAQLMVVCGSDAGGLDYPNWQENLAFALQLQLALQQVADGVCRPLSLRTGRYNQDLFPRMVLIEVGAAGNTRAEAMVAVQYLAEGILSLAQGAEWNDG